MTTISRSQKTRTGPQGSLSLDVTPAAVEEPLVAWSGWEPVVDGAGKVHWDRVADAASPRHGLPPEVNSWRQLGLPRVLAGLERRDMLTGTLFLDVMTADGRHLPYGLVSADLVTVLGVYAITDAFHGSSGTPLTSFHYHGIGTGLTPAAATDLGLEVEADMALSPAGLRANGTSGEALGNENIFQSVGSLVLASPLAVSEWGLCSAQPINTGDILDRAQFDVVNLGAGDTLTWTYNLVFTPGG